MKKLRILRDTGTIWFVVRDVMQELGYSNQTHTERVIESVPVEWKALRRVMTNGGAQRVWCISAEGLLHLSKRTCRSLPGRMVFALRLLTSKTADTA
jgi:prophage antirepressor-like protein